MADASNANAEHHHLHKMMKVVVSESKACTVVITSTSRACPMRYKRPTACSCPSLLGAGSKLQQGDDDDLLEGAERLDDRLFLPLDHLVG